VKLNEIKESSYQISMFTEYTNWYLSDILFKATELFMEHLWIWTMLLIMHNQFHSNQTYLGVAMKPHERVSCDFIATPIGLILTEPCHQTTQCITNLQR